MENDSQVVFGCLQLISWVCIQIYYNRLASTMEHMCRWGYDIFKWRLISSSSITIEMFKLIKSAQNDKMSYENKVLVFSARQLSDLFSKPLTNSTERMNFTPLTVFPFEKHGWNIESYQKSLLDIILFYFFNFFKLIAFNQYYRFLFTYSCPTIMDRNFDDGFRIDSVWNMVYTLSAIFYSEIWNKNSNGTKYDHWTWCILSRNVGRISIR